jgi:hypothetical protein
MTIHMKVALQVCKVSSSNIYSVSIAHADRTTSTSYIWEAFANEGALVASWLKEWLQKLLTR